MVPLLALSDTITGGPKGLVNTLRNPTYQMQLFNVFKNVKSIKKPEQLYFSQMSTDIQ